MDQFECGDILVRNDDGSILYRGPRFLRCPLSECGRLVTHGQVQEGGCICGGRRFRAAVKVTEVEQKQLLAGAFPLVEWEKKALGLAT